MPYSRRKFIARSAGLAVSRGGAHESVNSRPAEDETNIPGPVCSASTRPRLYLPHIKNLELSHVEIHPALPTRAHRSTSTIFIARTSSPSPHPLLRPCFLSIIAATCASSSVVPLQTSPSRKPKIDPTPGGKMN